MSDHHPVTALVTHRLITVPAYRLVTLSDQDADADPGSVSLLEEAARDIAATDGSTLTISVVQDLLPVGLTVTVVNATPHAAARSVTPLRLDCPSGQLTLGSPTGSVIGIDVEPGTYSVTVEHQGRDAAATRHQEILHQTSSVDDIEAAVDSTPLTEQYTITMWRTGDIDDRRRADRS
ncbi:hypothetical protein [Amycolatopsis lurida]|uniref:hypothetical protein n=1 Tax=Amycolatopsis lurida TaxID=31959 RepID=UPI003653152D